MSSEARDFLANMELLLRVMHFDVQFGERCGPEDMSATTVTNMPALLFNLLKIFWAMLLTK
jgi:hypothetical protein